MTHEEHNRIGTWQPFAVAGRHPVRVVRLGINDVGQSGSAEIGGLRAHPYIL